MSISDVLDIYSKGCLRYLAFAFSGVEDVHHREAQPSDKQLGGLRIRRGPRRQGSADLQQQDPVPLHHGGPRHRGSIERTSGRRAEPCRHAAFGSKNGARPRRRRGSASGPVFSQRLPSDQLWCEPVDGPEYDEGERTAKERLRHRNRGSPEVALIPHHLTCLKQSVGHLRQRSANDPFWRWTFNPTYDFAQCCSLSFLPNLRRGSGQRRPTSYASGPPN